MRLPSLSTKQTQCPQGPQPPGQPPTGIGTQMPETQWYPEGQEPFKQGMNSWLKLCRILKPVPVVLTANTVPLPEPPPPSAVPYRMSPDEMHPTTGAASTYAAKYT